MTDVMQHNMNIRKRRIMEALKDEQSETTLSCTEVSMSKEHEPMTEELRKKLIASVKDESAIIEMKVKVLEGWEQSKRAAIERLVKDVEEMQELEDQIDSLEEQILSHNIEIDEDDFEKFCQADMIKNPPLEPLDPLVMPQPQTPKRQEKTTKRSKISATSTPISRKPAKTDVADKFEANEDGMVVIGPNGTMISKAALQAINWHLSGAALTRKILMEVFGRETLAFHTLTGKPSPAFMDCDKPMKNQLDPLKVADIIHLVMEHTKLTAKEVRNAITTKCADENKMFRQREKKRLNAALKLKQQGGK